MVRTEFMHNIAIFLSELSDESSECRMYKWGTIYT